MKFANIIPIIINCEYINHSCDTLSIRFPTITGITMLPVAMQMKKILDIMPVNVLICSENQENTEANITDIPYPISITATQIAGSVSYITASRNNTAPIERTKKNVSITADRLTKFTATIPDRRPIVNAIQYIAEAVDPADLLQLNSVVRNVIKNPTKQCSLTIYNTNVRANNMVNIIVIFRLKKYCFCELDFVFSLEYLPRALLYTLPYIQSINRKKLADKRHMIVAIE